MCPCLLSTWLTVLSHDWFINKTSWELFSIYNTLRCAPWHGKKQYILETTCRSNTQYYTYQMSWIIYAHNVQHACHWQLTVLQVWSSDCINTHATLAIPSCTKYTSLTCAIPTSCIFGPPSSFPKWWTMVETVQQQPWCPCMYIFKCDFFQNSNH